MPMYEYSCRDCDCTFETLVIDSDGKPLCPSCEGESVERLIGLPAAPRRKMPRIAWEMGLHAACLAVDAGADDLTIST
jgi:putative FmdB family regulatory protein